MGTVQDAHPHDVLKKNHVHTKNGPKAVEYEHQDFPKMYYHVKGKKVPRAVSSQKEAEKLGKDWTDKAPELEGGNPESVAASQAALAAELDQE